MAVPVEPWPDRTVGSPASQELYDDLGQATLAEAMRQVARCGYRAAHPHFLVGAPVAMVLHLVENLDADLLVLGGNPPGAARWAIGGPLIGLAHHAACPTLVVRGRGAAPGRPPGSRSRTTAGRSPGGGGGRRASRATLRRRC